MSFRNILGWQKKFSLSSVPGLLRSAFLEEMNGLCWRQNPPAGSKKRGRSVGPSGTAARTSLNIGGTRARTERVAGRLTERFHLSQGVLGMIDTSSRTPEKTW